MTCPSCERRFGRRDHVRRAAAEDPLGDAVVHPAGQVTAERVPRRVRISSVRTYHETKPCSPADVDDQVVAWLTEALPVLS